MKENVNLAEILKSNVSLFGENPTVRSDEKGYTNQIYDIDNKYIIKVCNNEANEQRFKNEIAFYQLNYDNPIIPKLLTYSLKKDKSKCLYSVTEKAHGKSLYYVWHDLSNEEKKSIIKKIAEALKKFHSHQKENFDYGAYLSNLMSYPLNILTEKKILSIKENAQISESFKTFSYFLRSDKVVLIHNELHFDNILYYNGDIKIIDFERSIYAPVDKELDVFLRMCNNPKQYASKEVESFIHNEDFMEIKQLMKEYYPSMFDAHNFNERLLIYDMRDAFELLMNYPEERRIKEIIVKNSCELVNRYNKLKQ